MPIKLYYTGFLLLIVLCFSGCNNSVNSTDFDGKKLGGTPLFHLSHFESIIEAPISSPEIFNRNALKLLGITRITIYSKGGKNPEDTLDKMTFRYSDNWTNLDFELKEFNENPVLWTKGTIRLDSNFNGKSEFDRYFGIDKKITSEFINLPDKYLIVRQKSNKRKDTTTYFGSYCYPKSIVKRIGKQILSAEIFLPYGSSSKMVKSAFLSLKLDTNTVCFADRSVTFTVNNRPVETYLLNEKFSQVNLLKSWKYDAYNKLIGFQEWSGSNQLKTIIIHYSDNLLPDYFSVNNKTYFIQYN